MDDVITRLLERQSRRRRRLQPAHHALERGVGLRATALSALHEHGFHNIDDWHSAPGEFRHSSPLDSPVADAYDANAVDITNVGVDVDNGEGANADISAGADGGAGGNTGGDAVSAGHAAHADSSVGVGAAATTVDAHAVFARAQPGRTADVRVMGGTVARRDEPYIRDIDGEIRIPVLPPSPEDDHDSASR